MYNLILIFVFQEPVQEPYKFGGSGSEGPKTCASLELRLPSPVFYVY